MTHETDADTRARLGRIRKAVEEGFVHKTADQAFLLAELERVERAAMEVAQASANAIQELQNELAEARRLREDHDAEMEHHADRLVARMAELEAALLSHAYAPDGDAERCWCWDWREEGKHDARCLQSRDALAGAGGAK